MFKNYEKDLKIGNILGINVLSSPKDELLARIELDLTHNVKFYIVTPNPELIVMAQKNRELKKALNSAKYPIPDAIGISQAAKFLSFNLPRNKALRVVVGFFEGLAVGLSTFINKKWLTSDITPIKGRFFFNDLVNLANDHKWKVFLLGGEGDEAEIASRVVKKKYKKIQIEYSPGPKFYKNGDAVTEVDKRVQKDVIDKINKFNPKLLFVAFGNPKQEIWIYKNFEKLDIGGAMAVGGTLRYVSGLSKLPPKWIENAGLEWLWRLITEPWRFKRILNAWPVFPWKVFLSKISSIN